MPATSHSFPEGKSLALDRSFSSLPTGRTEAIGLTLEARSWLPEHLNTLEAWLCSAWLPEHLGEREQQERHQCCVADVMVAAGSPIQGLFFFQSYPQIFVEHQLCVRASLREEIKTRMNDSQSLVFKEFIARSNR